MYPVEIRDMPGLHLAGLAHTGPYDQIGPTFMILGERLGQAGLADKATLWAGIYHDDPGAQDPATLRAHACAALPAGTPLPDGFDAIDLPGGRMAVMTVTGPYDRLAGAWDWLYGTWFAQAGETPGTPALEVYVTMAPAVAEAEQITEIRVPLLPR